MGCTGYEHARVTRMRRCWFLRMLYANCENVARTWIARAQVPANGKQHKSNNTCCPRNRTTIECVLVIINSGFDQLLLHKLISLIWTLRTELRVERLTGRRLWCEILIVASASRKRRIIQAIDHGVWNGRVRLLASVASNRIVSS